MKLVTPEVLATTVAERWKQQYHRAEGWYSKSTQVTYEALVKLGPTPTPDAVKAIVGGGWAQQNCSECNDGVACVEVGQPADYESMTAYLCWACLQKAVSLAG